MIKSDYRGALLLSLFILAGCVSTTTGPAEKKPSASDAADLNYQLGARYYQNGEYDLARDRLKLSLEINPGNAIAWTTLGLTYEALGNLRLAEDAYDHAVRAEPRNYRVQENYAVFLCQRGRYDEGLTHFDRAIKAPTNDYAERTYTNAAVCLMQKPDYRVAETYLREALGRRSNYPEALFQMSVLFYRTEDFLKARAFIERYLDANAATAESLFLAVKIEEALDDDRARLDYEEDLLKKFPDSPQAKNIRQSR